MRGYNIERLRITSALIQEDHQTHCGPIKATSIKSSGATFASLGPITCQNFGRATVLHTIPFSMIFF